jgi:hypothetical protein
MKLPPSNGNTGGSLLRTVKVVLWAFLGIRKDSEVGQDFSQIKPVNVIIVGVLAALTFVLVLVGIVNWVLAV